MSALSRRHALLSAVAAGGALALPAATLVPQQPDAGTMALIARFVHLERYRRSLYEPSPYAIEDDAERGIYEKKIGDAQEAIVEQIEALPVNNPATVAALARAAIIWWPDLVSKACQTSLDGKLMKMVFLAWAPDAVAEAEWREEHANELSAEDLAWLRVNGGAA
jgi:hypothetical protein